MELCFRSPDDAIRNRRHSPECTRATRKRGCSRRSHKGTPGARGAPPGSVRGALGAASLPARPGERQARNRRAFQGRTSYAEGTSEAPVGIPRAAPQTPGGRCRGDTERRGSRKPRPRGSERGGSGPDTHRSAGSDVVVPAVHDAHLASWNARRGTLQMRPERVPPRSSRLTRGRPISTVSDQEVPTGLTPE